MTDGPNSHVRWNRSVFARLERRALEWIARRLPDGDLRPMIFPRSACYRWRAPALAFAAFRWNDGAGRGWSRSGPRRKLGRRQPGRHGRARQAHRASAVRLLRRPRHRSGGHHIPVRGPCVFGPDVPAVGGRPARRLPARSAPRPILGRMRPVCSGCRSSDSVRPNCGLCWRPVRIKAVGGATVAIPGWQASDCSMRARSWRLPVLVAAFVVSAVRNTRTPLCGRACPAPGRPKGRMISRLATFAAVGALAVGAGLAAARHGDIAAWDEFVARAENGTSTPASATPVNRQGKTYEIPGGTIHQWQG